MRRGFALGLIAAALATRAVTADEGRIPIYQVTSVSETGGYVLTRDISASSTDAIRIQAEGVTLDLNGHTISVDGAAAGIFVAPNVTSVVIRNGRIVGGGNGIVYAPAPARGRIRVEGVDVTSPASYGIYVSGAESVEIRSSHVAAPGLDGIYVDGASASFSGRFVDNAVTSSGRYGLYLRGLAGGEVKRNVVIGSAASGIELTADPAWGAGSNIIEANTVRGGGPGSVGIDLQAAASSNIVSKNVVTGNALQGIFVVSSGNLVAENQVSGSGQEGIRVDGGYNLVERNLSTGNLYGLRMACGGSRYRDNMLLGNTTIYCTGACCSTGNAGGNLTN